MKKAGIIGIAAVVLLVAVGLWAKMEWFSSGTFRYKMTVSVETPEGLKTGSAVREVYVRQNPKITPESLPHIEVRGEAVIVDLGQRGKLFAIMKNSMGPDYAYMVVFKAIGGNLSPEGLLYLDKLLGHAVTLTPEHYPMLVMFKDIKDPKTIKLALDLDNESKAPFRQFVSADHFEELFGDGVRLKEITIELTDEPVTWGIKEVLPVFGNIPRPIGYYDFIKGV